MFYHFFILVNKIIIFRKIKKKPGGPPKGLRGLQEGRGPPVEKHWPKGFSNDINHKESSSQFYKTFFSSLTKNFLFFAVKLCHFIINFFPYVTNTQA